MLISPPFLPAPVAGETETAWLSRAMVQPTARAPGTKALEGSFPVSANMQWHTGIHWVAPKESGAFLPVRAIADGVVVFVSPPTPHSSDAGHPQNYAPGGIAAWSDNGCVIVQHTTDIGLQGLLPTRITYFSLCMHLCSIANGPRAGGVFAPWRAGDRIYRKDAIGAVGKVYEADANLHFEICCDEANVAKIIGRPPVWTETEPPAAPTSDGRTDAVIGSVFVYLPSGTPTQATAPTTPLRAGAAGAQPLSAAHWVEIRHDHGTAYLRTYDASGQVAGGELVAADFEYDLYAEANTRHAAYLAAGGTQPSSPSGWYELLRFGRNLGQDPLPGDAAHWREIRTAQGTVWADLNAPGTCKFSEADFLPVMGWNCFNDDPSPLDQRCDSVELKRRIRDRNPATAGRMSREQLGARLGEESVQQQLKKAICKFPSEWDRTTIEARHRWLRDPKEAFGLDDPVAWDHFAKHCAAMSFDDLPTEYKTANWRFHPGMFIDVMRRSGWLSKEETAQAIPATKGGTIESVSRLLEMQLIDRAGRVMRPNLIHPSISRIMRKYGITTKLRMAHWLAQILQETGGFQSLREFGDATYLTNYYEGRCRTPIQRIIKGTLKTLSPLGNCASGDGIRFSGKGLIQLTGGDNYRSYETYRGRQNFTVDPGPEMLITDALTACDAGGLYWTRKQRFRLFNGKPTINGKLGINYWAEKATFYELPPEATLSAVMKDVTGCVNAALEGQSGRTEFFKHAFRYLSDINFPNDPFRLKHA